MGIFKKLNIYPSFLQSCKHIEDDRIHELGLVLTSRSLLQRSVAHRSKYNEVDLVIQQNWCLR